MDSLGSDNESYIIPQNRIPIRSKEQVFAAQLTTDRDTLSARFWAKVDQAGPDACWRWTASLGSRYGQFSVSAPGRRFYNIRAHRAAWILTHGPIAPGLHVLHSCDVPTCVNPAHLSLGTHDQNMRDAVAKGRHMSCRFVRSNAHVLTVAGAELIYKPSEKLGRTRR